MESSAAQIFEIAGWARNFQAVADGEMTGEEARAAWESECGGKDR